MCVQKLFCILVLVFIVFNTAFCSVEAAKISYEVRIPPESEFLEICAGLPGKSYEISDNL